MTTPSITFNQVSGDTNGSPSYFDIAISASNYSWLTAGSAYDSWCLNPVLPLPYGVNLTAYVYSSLEVSVWSSSVSTLTATAKSSLDEINWLLNYFSDKIDTTLTYGDVQAAMWTLAGYTWASEAPYIGAYSQTRIDNLVALASSHNGYVPEVGDLVALVLDPHRADGSGTFQPIITSALAAGLGDYVWEDSDADGVQDANEHGIAGAKVELVRDLNGDGTISANEVLATTTTDANGQYKFVGLTPGFDYQVRFTNPTGYTNGSPRQADGSGTSGTNSDGALSDVVQLKPGEFNGTLDSGFYKLASLGDRVWNDTNGNGKQDAGETGRAGVKVELYTCAVNGQPEMLVATTTTDANGNYLFDSLKPGTYHVKFYAPTGTSFTTVDVGDDTADSDANSAGISGCYTLNSGDANTTVDAGLVPLGALGDRVWIDANANGQQDAGEVGKAGVTVQLLNAAGTVIGTQTTDANGNYLFNNLAAGTYSVQFGAVAGFTRTSADTGNDATDSDANATTGRTGTYTLGVGETNLSVDAGIYQLASLGDKVWNDTNGNGKQDAGETGRAGVKVELYTCAVNGQPEALVGTTTTDANGNYLFDGLKPGTYHVKFYAPTGTSFTTVDVGGDDATDSDANSAGISGCYTLNSGDANTTVDAGLVPLGALGDRVWIDANANGQQDAGEVGKAGVTVQLLNSAGTVIGTQTTDANGNYLFKDLAAGTYSVQFGAVAGFTRTSADTGNDASDSDANATTGKTGTYTLGVGETNVSVDAGIYQLASLGDKVWNDTNGNGKQDAGETGRAGVKVELYTCAVNGQPEVLVGTTTTDANGNYLFDSLKPGTYHVKFYAPTGTSFTTVDVGGDDAADSDANSAGISGCYTLNSGDANTSVDAGLVPLLGALGDRVWYDTNRNGVQDGGEVGKAGVYISLYDVGADGMAGTADDAWLGYTVTDANGNYLFKDLKAGKYSVWVADGWGLNKAVDQLTITNAGGNDAADSDISKILPDGISGYSDVVTLGWGETNLTVDIGIVDKLGALGDRVWIDTNGNGQQDAGELGKAGVTVQLLNAAGTVIGTQTTDANGNRVLLPTRGGVAMPGKAILEIVPDEALLQMTARVQPNEIGFLHPGQKAKVTVLAYDSATFGQISATLERVGADAIVDEKGNAYFEVQLSAERGQLKLHGKPLALSPGMPVELSILTGERSVMQYLLKPVLRGVQGALQER